MRFPRLVADRRKFRGGHHQCGFRHGYRLPLLAWSGDSHGVNGRDRGGGKSRNPHSRRRVLELAHRLDTVVLDKTGTLTEGKPKVTDVIANGIDEGELMALAAGGNR